MKKTKNIQKKRLTRSGVKYRFCPHCMYKATALLSTLKIKYQLNGSSEAEVFGKDKWWLDQLFYKHNIGD